MRNRSFAVSATGFLLLALFAVGVLPRGGTSVAALTNCSTSEAGINAAEQRMLELINSARAAAGLSALKLSPNLNRAAAWKAADGPSNGLGGGFSHTDSLGRNPVEPFGSSKPTRPQDCGYATGAAENLAYGSSGAQPMFDLWMSSTMGHREIILSTTYKVVGIGQHGGAWAANFGYLDDSGDTSPPPPPATSTPIRTVTATSAGSTATPASTATQPPAATPTTASATPTTATTPKVVSGISLGLSAGVNLVTYTGETQPVPAALRSLQGYVEAVYQWDPVHGVWEKYAPGRPGYVNSFANLRAGNVYYIQVSADVTWAY